MTDKLQQEYRIGVRASELLENNTFDLAVNNLLQGYFEEFVNSDSIDKRNEASLKTTCLKGVVGEIEKLINSGNVAKRKLDKR